MNRRSFIGAAAVGGLSAVAHAQFRTADASKDARAARSPDAARIRQSVCRWCFGGMTLEDLCKTAAQIGYTSIELLGPDEWDVPRRHGLGCALASAVKSNPIGKGLNRVEHHDAIIAELEERLPLVASAGIPQQIVFSGNRDGMEPREGLRNCVTGLKRITPLAEKLGVTIVMELLNSKVDHKDYMCDRTVWGFELVRRVGSPRFKMLYDIYHMQIMEGDVIRTITANLDMIGHFHTAGVPGRNDLDETQELQYRAIMTAIAEKSFAGFVGQEFLPRGDAKEALRHAFDVCNV